MNIETYNQLFSSYKTFYLDKRVQGMKVTSVRLLDVPCYSNTLVLRLELNDGEGFINFFTNQITDLGVKSLEEKFLGQTISYCFTSFEHIFDWRKPFDCELVYSAKWVFSNGAWASVDNPFNTSDDSCESSFLAVLEAEHPENLDTYDSVDLVSHYLGK